VYSTYLYLIRWLDVTCRLYDENKNRINTGRYVADRDHSPSTLVHKKRWSSTCNICLIQVTRTLLPEQGWSWSENYGQETKNSYGKYSFVNRAYRTLAPTTCRNFPCRYVFRKRFRKTIISDVTWRILKRADEVSKWREVKRSKVQWSEVKWSEDLWCNVCIIISVQLCSSYVGIYIYIYIYTHIMLSYCYLICVFCYFLCSDYLFCVFIIRFVFVFLLLFYMS
jgi:hypothetical protein